MFDVLKKDIEIGYRIKLFLTTGKEPEGVVSEIGDNYILLKVEGEKPARYFDKLIGGWEIVEIKQELIKIKNVDSEKTNQLEQTGQEADIDKEFLQESLTDLLKNLDDDVLNIFVEPNANIIDVRGTTCQATNSAYQKILILNSRIADEELIEELENFKIGSIIPVWLTYYDKKNKKEAMATVAVKPNTIKNIIDQIRTLIEKNEFEKTKSLLWILKPYIKKNKYLGQVIREFKKLKKLNTDNYSPQALHKINIQNPEDPDERKKYKTLEREINTLIRDSNFEKALSQIEIDIKKDIPDKYKSSLLLKKAQIYSSLSQPSKSEQAYQELVLFNESMNTSPNNLSHLYTELARLQALDAKKLDLALGNVKKALKYKPNNSLANNLLKQIETKLNSSPDASLKKEESEEHLVIDSFENTDAISKLIDIDIKEHKFTHQEILKNGGKPTAYIAKLIFEQAKKNRDIDISERYPTYLEAAKAFSILNVGSYDLQDYLEAIAYYSILKGNSLFVNFRKLILSNDMDVVKLTRLKDSASSYYIEALNLLSNINPKSLLVILANYLKLNIVTYHVENSIDANFGQLFKGQFSDVFSFCLKNKDKEIEKIAYKTIVDIGAASINAWNELAKIPKGTSDLYRQFTKPANRVRIFTIINKINNAETDVEKKPAQFLRESFLDRIKAKNRLDGEFEKILKLSFISSNYNVLYEKWIKLSSYDYLLSETDIEARNSIGQILTILQPYLNRNETERTNLLLQARSIIEKQIKFINENTTYYGRTLFYGLLTKWKSEIDDLLEVKIAETLPILHIRIDPPYYIKTNDKYSVQLLIGNEGETTSEGYSMNILYESPEYEYDDEIKFSIDSKVEISAGSQIATNIEIPNYLIEDYEAVDITINIQAKYQNKMVKNRKYKFTVEKEPATNLTYEDIPWKDGPIPPEHLFKGRKELITDLLKHYLSYDRDKPYILYGLTRTGKSSILKYLKKAIEKETILINRKQYRVIAFEWEFQELSNNSNAEQFYEALLYERMYTEIKKLFIENEIWDNKLEIPEEKTRFKHLKLMLNYLNTKGYFPMFFIDELSYIKDLMDRDTIGPAFLAALRQYSLDGIASFIFAGTYDIRNLITEEKYGITGQFVHAIEFQVDRIKDPAAEELINILGNKLTFTPDAVHHIKFLSGNIPYFIQIICKSCGDYAVENNRRHIGYPELEKVIQILIGEEENASSLVKRLPAGKFQNNQYSPSDPKEVAVLLSSLAYFNKGRINPRGVGIHELERLWSDHRLVEYRPRLALALEDLMEKKIIYQDEDEGLPVYKFSVDIFRRWWYNKHQDINLELTTLAGDNEYSI